VVLVVVDVDVVVLDVVVVLVVVVEGRVVVGADVVGGGVTGAGASVVVAIVVVVISGANVSPVVFGPEHAAMPTATSTAATADPNVLIRVSLARAPERAEAPSPIVIRS